MRIRMICLPLYGGSVAYSPEDYRQSTESLMTSDRQHDWPEYLAYLLRSTALPPQRLQADWEFITIIEAIRPCPRRDWTWSYTEKWPILWLPWLRRRDGEYKRKCWPTTFFLTLAVSTAMTIIFRKWLWSTRMAHLVIRDGTPKHQESVAGICEGMGIPCVRVHHHTSKFLI